MKYEVQVWVTVSADDKSSAYKIIKRQIERRDYDRKSELLYIDADVLKSEPECADCGVVLADVTLDDGTLCESCGKVAAGTDEAVR